ncbi:MAG: hypothetical protein JXR37_32065 [Kiritimatiellae bacterium]|nr:hypothetical protein [Kiritimatiellia bacterium]
MKRLKITAIVIVCLLGLWAGSLSLRRDWLQPVPSVRLEPHRPILKGEDVAPDSAFGLFRQALDLGAVDVSGLPGTSDNDWPHDWGEGPGSNVLAVLEGVRPNLESARKAGKAPNPQVPTLLEFDVDAFEYIWQATQVVQLLVASARQKTAAGDIAGAMAELRDAMRFVRILGYGGGSAHLMTWMENSKTCCRALRWMALRRTVPREALLETCAFLADYTADTDSFPEALRYDCLVIANTPLALLVKEMGLPTPRSPFDSVVMPLAPVLGSTRGVTADTIKGSYAHFIALAEKPYAATAWEALAGKMRFRPLSLLLDRDPVGLRIIGTAVEAYAMEHRSYLSALASIRATAAVLAIAGHRREHGQLPKTLGELVPAYLPEPPEDPFDQKPMRYKIVADGTWRVYSVGEDGKDDGGSGASAPGGEDIVFSSGEFDEEPGTKPKKP